MITDLVHCQLITEVTPGYAVRRLQRSQPHLLEWSELELHLAQNCFPTINGLAEADIVTSNMEHELASVGVEKLEGTPNLSCKTNPKMSGDLVRLIRVLENCC